MLHAMPALVLNTSLSGLTEILQSALPRLHRSFVRELLGWGWMNALHADDYSVERFCAALAAETPFEKEIRIRSAAGEYR